MAPRTAIAPKPIPLPNTVSPRDPATGLPTGKRQHKPFAFRITYDQ